MELYFDADSGALLYKTKEGYYEIVKTNAQLDPAHLRMDEEGHLYLKSYTDDSEHAMVDVSGAKISLKGPAGEKGEKGDQGEKGDKGDQGIQGERGPKGDSGSNGTDGVNGVDGKDGHTYVPSVDVNGNLSWRLSDLAEIPSPINIRGPKGDMGEKGADGIIYTPTVSAEGVLSWTSSTNILNPQAVNIKGPKGEKGDTGATGSQGEKGEKGDKGDDGKGLEYSFPTNPKLGDTFIWGGESGLNDNCFLGYVMTGQQYVYSQLPNKLGLSFANEKTCLIPMHVMIYIPDLLQTSLTSVQFNKSTQIQPLTFHEDKLVESLTTITNILGNEQKYMSWAVSYGLTDLQIKQLQSYIINIAKSIFDNKVTEYTTNYTSTYQMPKYLQGSAMKCKYSNFLEEGTIFNKLFTYLQENPSNIFTGLQQAIADKLSENDDYNPDVYIIPIQAVDNSNLSKSWTSEMPELPEGWAPCDSVLHNGFNTNQVGNIYEMPEIGGGDVEM